MRKLLVSLAILAGLTLPALAQVGFRINLNLGPPPVYVAPPEYPYVEPAPAYPPQYVYPYQGYTPAVWGHDHRRPMARGRGQERRH